MSVDRILVPLPDGRWLGLDRDTFDAALIAGKATMAPASNVGNASSTGTQERPRLLSAEEMETATGIPATWYAAQARERRIPFRKLGRYVRFVCDEVVGCEAFQRRAIPDGQMN